jgi:hypothetical protein
MIAKCANPACRTRFDHRIGGKFFRFRSPEKQEADETGKEQNTHNVVHYWLCPVCTRIFSLTCTQSNKVVLTFVEEEFSVESTEKEFTAA